jgi:hypothetical protein
VGPGGPVRSRTLAEPVSCVATFTSTVRTDRVAASVTRVTGTMLGRSFVPSFLLQAAPWRAAVLVSTGKEPFAVAVSSDRAGCAAIASSMLGIPEDDLDLAMIDDVLRELANMTAGQLKRELAGEQTLGLPKIQDGETLLAAAGRWSHHILSSDAIQLVVSLTSTIL